MRSLLAMGSISESVTKAAQEVNAMLTKAGGDSTELKSVMDSVVAKLEAHGLAYRRRVCNDHVGVHPCNRFGMGVSPVDCQSLLLEIAKQGWSYAETARAAAAEVPPGAEGELARRFNADLVACSDGLLAPQGVDAIEVLTVCCSHTAQGLRAAKNGAKGIHPEVCADGRLSRERLCELSPSMKDRLKSPTEILISHHPSHTPRHARTHTNRIASFIAVIPSIHHNYSG